MTRSKQRVKIRLHILGSGWDQHPLVSRQEPLTILLIQERHSHRRGKVGNALIIHRPFCDICEQNCLVLHCRQDLLAAETRL